MTKIEDMSAAERYNWVALIATTGVFWWFWNKFVGFQGLSTISPRGLTKIYIQMVILAAISHAIVAMFFVLRGEKHALWSDKDIEKDERDIEIERRADRNGFWVLAVAINIIIVQVLIEGVAGEGYAPPLRINSPSGMVFSLTVSVFIADIVKRASVILGYR